MAAAPSATHVDVCNERVPVDKGKHVLGPHAAKTTCSQLLGVADSSDRARMLYDMWTVSGPSQLQLPRAQ